MRSYQTHSLVPEKPEKDYTLGVSHKDHFQSLTLDEELEEYVERNKP